jgi:hypothetical protein
MEMRRGAHSGTLLHVTCHSEGAFPPCHSEGAERVLNEVKEKSHLMGSATERQWWILRGVYPERCEILRYAQNDRGEGLAMTDAQLGEALAPQLHN